MSSAAVGLAGGSRVALADRVLAAWDDFLTLAADADLDAPSRLPGWRAHEVCVHLGSWPGEDPVTGILASARTGGTDPLPPADEVNAHKTTQHRDDSRADVFDALERGRDAVAGFFDSPEADELGLALSASAVGPLPVLTLVHAASYELAVHALDLAPSGAPAPPQELLDAGLAALIDVTGSLAARHGIDATVAAQTPAGGWRFTSMPGKGWETDHVGAGRVRGTAVLGAATTLLDVSAGRQAVPPLLLSRALRVQDMPSFLALAPLVDAVPGIPGSGALKMTARTLSGVTGLVRRFSPFGR